jgi:hypothetical protein
MMGDMGRLCPVETINTVTSIQCIKLLTYKVEGCVLGFEKRQESTTSKRLAVQAWAQVMR